MDQRFSQGSDSFEITFEKENRRLGAVFLLVGAGCALAAWYFSHKATPYGAKLAVIILCGPVFLLMGLATVISPPKTEFKSEANKRRNGVLSIIGLVLGVVALYFYNDIYGVW